MFWVEKICSQSSASQVGSSIHEKVIQHAKSRHADFRNGLKHSPGLKMVAGTHACVPCMCVEQMCTSFFQHQPGSGTNLKTKTIVRQPAGKKKSLITQGLLCWGMQSPQRAFYGIQSFVQPN
jgi:hypothetical protein